MQSKEILGRGKVLTGIFSVLALGAFIFMPRAAAAHGLEITSPSSPLVVIGISPGHNYYSFHYKETATVPAEALANPEAIQSTVITETARGRDGQLRTMSHGTLDQHGIFRTDEDLKGLRGGASDIVVVLPGAPLPAIGPNSFIGSFRCPPRFDEGTCHSRDDAIQHGVPALLDLMRSVLNVRESITFHLTHLPAVAPTPVPLPAPTVELLVEPETDMGLVYGLDARLTNNAAEPIKVRVDWREHYTFPQPFDPAQANAREVELAPNETREVALGLFQHSWEWIPPANPIQTIPETLNDIAKAFISLISHVEDWKNIMQVGRGLIGKTFLVVTKLHEILSQDTMVQRQTTIRYTASATYDRASAPSLGRDGSDPQVSTILQVPVSKQNYHTDFMMQSLLGGVLTDSGILLLFVNPPQGIAALLGEVAFLEMARTSYQQALDPPDPNFHLLATPMPITMPELETVPAGLWRTYTEALRTLQALKAAEGISRDRAAGAAQAGDLAMESTQLLLAGRYAAEAAAIGTRLIFFQEQLAPYITSTLLPLGSQLLAHLETEGLPALEVRYLRELGWTAEQIEAVRQGLIQAGVTPLADPRAATEALRVAALISASNSFEATQRAIDLRTSTLGQPVRALTSEEIAALNSAREAIAAGIARRIPSKALAVTIETFLTDVRHLLEDTNNFPELQPHLEAGLNALSDFQQLEVSLPGLRVLVGTLEQNGGITHEGIANSLRDKLADAEEDLAEGDFEDVRGTLGAFLHEVRAQRSKKITATAADDFTAYALYLQEFFPPEEADN